MNKEQLNENYTLACNAYLQVFCEKHDYLYEGTSQWVGNEPGTIANCGDGFYDMATIKTDIEECAPVCELGKWYDYCMEAADFNLTRPNFRSWLHGCPRTSPEVLGIMRKMREDLDELCKQENARVKNF